MCHKQLKPSGYSLVSDPDSKACFFFSVATLNQRAPKHLTILLLVKEIPRRLDGKLTTDFYFSRNNEHQKGLTCGQVSH